MRVLYFQKALLAGFLLFIGCSRKEPSEIFQMRPLYEYHKVLGGESLADIAKRYRMSEAELCRLNGLAPQAVLIPGQKIFVLPDAEHTVSKWTNRSSPVIVEAQSPSFLGAEKQRDTAFSEVKTDAPKKAEDTLTVPDEKEDGAHEAFIWPVKGNLLRRFHEKMMNNNVSEGINISAPVGTRVVACADGVVMDAGELVLGFGKMVIISHPSGFISIYGHLQEINVARPKPREVVSVLQGQVIGRVGKSGNVRAPQLHFQLRNSKKDPVDPLKYLDSEN
jgi:murein DD-endopeptidase MepM/ murein hydrolase activator NlpD